MEENEIKKLLGNIPQQLLPSRSVPPVNAPITLHNGTFQIILDGIFVDFHGDILLAWKPAPNVYFRAKTQNNTVSLESRPEKLQIEALTIEHGAIRLTNQGNNIFRGKITRPFLIVQTAAAIDRITFEIPNFRNYSGKPTRDRRNFSRPRLQWQDAGIEFTIDRLNTFPSTLEKLKEEGGFGITHTGQIRSISGLLEEKLIRPIIDRLGLFISFLNGGKTYPTLLRGHLGEECVWEDFSAFSSDPYIELDSWFPFMEDPKLGLLWKGFSAVTLKQEDYQCIDYMLHWLFEANKNSAMVEGSIVLLQNAFELLYNWKLKTKKEGKIDADEKIRRLLDHAHIPIGFHPDYLSMVNELRSHGLHFNNFPKLFTLIRNAIVHSDKNKLTQLNKYSGINRFYIKHIAFHHMELLLLYLFGYTGKYSNRLPMVRHTGTNEEDVPWAVL